jgi:sugar phosphate isomerase/epimerase
MTARLGGEVLIIHIPTTKPLESRPTWLRQIRKSLDQIELYAKSHSVRIALENMARDDWEMLETLLPEYGPGFVGLCFDSGHANLSGHDFGHLDPLKDRLIAVHLHDNDGIRDQHKIPFTGTVDWENLAIIIASSAYDQCVNLEVVFDDTDYPNEETFLQHAHHAGEQLTELIKLKRIIE